MSGIVSNGWRSWHVTPLGLSLGALGGAGLSVALGLGISNSVAVDLQVKFEKFQTTTDARVAALKIATDALVTEEEAEIKERNLLRLDMQKADSAITERLSRVEGAHAALDAAAANVLKQQDHLSALDGRSDELGRQYTSLAQQVGQMRGELDALLRIAGRRSVR